VTRQVYLLLLEFGRAHERQALDLLIPMLRRVFPGAALHATVIDNALAGYVEDTLDRDTDRIGGDNRVREFSGWDRGLAWLDRERPPAPDAVIVLANDTVVRPDKYDRVRGLPANRAAAVSSGALVGWIDEYPRPIQLFGLDVRQWVDTSLVIAERRTFAALGPLASAFTEDVFSDDVRNIFLEPSPLSANYRAYLEAYFWGDRIEPEFPQRWHAHAPLDNDTIESIKAKLRCVFCEHHLSARARALGIPLVDIRPVALPIDRLAAVEVQFRG
jgi:hypothetical protein